MRVLWCRGQHTFLFFLEKRTFSRGPWSSRAVTSHQTRDLVSATRCSGRHTDLHVCCALCGYNGSFFKICTTSGHFFKLSETIVVAQVDSHFTKLQGTSFCTAIHSSWGKTTTTTSSRGRDSPRLEDGNSAQTLTVTRELMRGSQRSRHTFDFRTTFLA